VLVWDNLNTHLTAGMRRYIAERDWLTVYQLPPYAPDPNPVEGIWSVLRRTTTANRAFANPHDLITAVRRGLRQLQYRHDVLDGCLTGTRLVPASPRCDLAPPSASGAVVKALRRRAAVMRPNAEMPSVGLSSRVSGASVSIGERRPVAPVDAGSHRASRW
jgi:hypothetical protein